MRMGIRIVMLGAVLAATGCASVGPAPEGALASAQEPQLDYNIGGAWRNYTLTTGSTQVAHVYTFSAAFDGFSTGTEYWYVNRDSLGTAAKNGLSISYVDEPSTTTPENPGYKDEQSFTNAENVSWGSGWTTDPLSGGALVGGPGGLYLRFKLSTLSPPTFTSLAWYQVLPSGSTPANIAPSGSFPLVGSVSVPGGSEGFDISQSP